MNRYRLLKAGRAAMIALTLICTADLQQARAVDVFDQPASWGNIAQLTTAVLTLPADLAATAKPTSTKRKLINHSLKLVNELLATWQQHSPYNAGWVCFDVVQSVRALTALLTTAPAELTNQIDEEQEIEAPVDHQQWQAFVRRANYILACAEAATRIWAARTNNNQPLKDLGDTRWEQLRGALHENSECVHSLTSLIRLARYCLQAPNKRQMAILLVLCIANAVASVWQYTTIGQSNVPPATPVTRTPEVTTTPAATTRAAPTTQPATTTPVAATTANANTQPMMENPVVANAQAMEPYQELREIRAVRPLTLREQAPYASMEHWHRQSPDHAIPQRWELHLLRCQYRFNSEQMDRHMDMGHAFASVLEENNAFNAWCRQHQIAPFFPDVDLAARDRSSTSVATTANTSTMLMPTDPQVTDQGKSSELQALKAARPLTLREQAPYKSMSYWRESHESPDHDIPRLWEANMLSCMDLFERDCQAGNRSFGTRDEHNNAFNAWCRQHQIAPFFPDVVLE